jgi:hypothetical protein
MDYDLLLFCYGVNEGMPHLRKSPDYYANVLKKVMMLKEEYMLNMIFICEPRSSFYPWPYDNYEKKFEEIIIGNPNNKVLNLSSILNQIEKEHGLRLENDGGVQKLVKYKKGRAKILKEIQYDLSAGIQSVSPEIYEYIDTHDINQATYIDGCHLNENGHRIAAQEIFKFLKSEKIVP